MKTKPISAKEKQKRATAELRAIIGRRTRQRDELRYALKELMDHWECGTHPGTDRWKQMAGMAGG